MIVDTTIPSVSRSGPRQVVVGASRYGRKTVSSDRPKAHRPTPIALRSVRRWTCSDNKSSGRRPVDLPTCSVGSGVGIRGAMTFTSLCVSGFALGRTDRNDAVGRLPARGLRVARLLLQFLEIQG